MAPCREPVGSSRGAHVETDEIDSREVSANAERVRQRLLRSLDVGSRVVAVATNSGGARNLIWGQPRSVAAATLVEGLQRELGFSPTLIIDGGANIGQFARVVSDGYPDAEIHSFEPVSDVFAVLQKNLGGTGSVHLNRKGLGSTPHQAVIHVNAYRHSSSILDTVKSGGASYGALETVRDEEIEVTTLDAYLADTAKTGPWLLKLDVQGYEYEVLRGAENTLSKFDAVLLEVGVRPTYEGELLLPDVIDFMRDKGFELDGILDVGRDDERRIVQMDALFKPR